MKTILITGAAGGIATQTRPLFRAHYRLRLSDRAPIPDPTPEEEVVQADLGDIEALRRAVAGVDGIVHLGGKAVEAEWDIIHDANIVGCYNLYEAARLEGVKRVVFASSNHAVGFYPRSETIGTASPNTSVVTRVATAAFASSGASSSMLIVSRPYAGISFVRDTVTPLSVK